MEWISKGNVLIVGLGLIGGSYAKGLKRMGFHVSAIDNNKASIDYAIKNDIIDEGSDKVEPEMVSNADSVIFALYPKCFCEWIKEYQHLFKSGIRITDVTGVKSCIIYDIQNVLREDVEFIGAHPMAGREVSGVENSDYRIFLNANYIVTPTKKNTEEAIKWCMDLGKLLGFKKISVLSPEEHDNMIGYLSQLTHCIAVTLMTCNDNPDLANYTGDSFRDLTRIARINDKMWCELFNMNKEVLLAEMDAFMAEFKELRDMLANGDDEGMRAKMRLSTERRGLFDNVTKGDK